MHLRPALGVSWEILGGYRLRSLLSVSCLAIGVAAVMVISGAGQGARHKLEQRLRAMGSNLLVVTAGQSRISGGLLRRYRPSQTLRPADARAIRLRCPAVETAAGSFKRSVIADHAGREVRTTFIAMEPEGFAVRNLRLAQGRCYTPSEERSKRRVLVMGPRAARNVFGAEPALGRVVRLARQTFRVIGLTASRGMDLAGDDQDNAVYLPLSVGLTRLAQMDHIETIYIKAVSQRDMDRAAGEIRSVLRGRHRLRDGPDDFTIHSQLDLVRLEQESVQALTSLAGSVAVLTWLMGAAGIVAVMLVTVRERRWEIGLRLSVGARPRDILLQFLCEAGALGACAGLAGVALGTLATWLAGASGLWPAEVGWLLAGFSLAGSVLLGLVCGTYPAWRASRMTPVQALAR